MTIQNLIVHEVQKEESSESEIKFREDENAINNHAESLNSQLANLFKKTGLNTGQFSQPEDEDEPSPHFLTLVSKHYSENSFPDFIAFSQAAAKEFKRHLDASPSSKGGYLWFNHYIHNKENFLSIVLLRKKHGLRLLPSLNLDQIEELDLDKLHMAARINLTAWKSNASNRYIAFRVGRGAKDVTEYFSSFVGCEEYTKAKLDTQNLVNVTKAYCSHHNFSDEKTEDVKQFVSERCLSWLSDETPVQLENLSTLLDSSFDTDGAKSGIFLEIAQSDPYNLSNEIPIEKSALRGLTRFSGRSKKLSLSFDSDLVNKSVFYHAERKTLTIQDLPADLVAQLEAEHGS